MHAVRLCCGLLEERHVLATGSARWEWSAHVCLYVFVCMQQFDRSDKDTVVVYTLVLTCCADHILSAYGPLPTSLPVIHTDTLRPPPPSLHLTPNSKLFICDAQCFLCFFSFTVPLVKVRLRYAATVLIRTAKAAPSSCVSVPVCVFSYLRGGCMIWSFLLV